MSTFARESIVDSEPRDSDVVYSEKVLEILQNQLKNIGHTPLDFIPLEDLQAEISVLVHKLNSGLPYDENRLEYLLLCLEMNPDHKNNLSEENRLYRTSVLPYCYDCLLKIRTFVPPHIFKSSINSLISEGMSKGLASRLFNKKCLWLVRMSQSDISKLHIAELRGRYNFEGQQLDIVEMAALYSCVPTQFQNDDAKCSKAEWRESLENSFKILWKKKVEGTLEKSKIRNKDYETENPLFTSRETLHHMDNVSSRIPRLSS
jgi:hypothetical protein